VVIRKHTLLLDSEGVCWSCGSDEWYQLGHGESWKVVKERDIAFVTGKKKTGRKRERKKERQKGPRKEEGRMREKEREPLLEDSP
jgi:alpha-tubulin suppressor-like RCC1 family protein